jgi:hypothetical protein
MIKRIFYTIAVMVFSYELITALRTKEVNFTVACFGIGHMILGCITGILEGDGNNEN